MPVSEAEVARRVEEFSAALRSAGFRLTHQRLEVVREVASTDVHPDAEWVYTRVRERVPTISLDTVYRTLGTLSDLGLVRRVAGASGAVRYDANDERHHHFVCTKCGLIRDIESADLDDLGIPEPAVLLGSVDSVEVRFSGVCRACSGGDVT